MGSARPLGALALGASTLLAGCGSAAPPADPTDVVSVKLDAVPAGLAWVTAPSQPGSLEIAYELKGLQMTTDHPMDITEGPCTQQQGAVTKLAGVAADPSGNAAGAAVLPAAVGAVPPRGWCLRLHAGPGVATPEQTRVIAHADLTSANSSRVRAAAVQGQGVAGTARIAYDIKARVLNITVDVSGLEPKSEHPNHIHVGQCTLQGPVRIILTRLVADAAGKAHSTTRVPQADPIVHGGWYVAVHQGPGLDVQDQFTPVLCGDVPVRQA